LVRLVHGAGAGYMHDQRVAGRTADL
jgi:hypothetical protein